MVKGILQTQIASFVTLDPLVVARVINQNLEEFLMSLSVIRQPLTDHCKYQPFIGLIGVVEDVRNGPKTVHAQEMTTANHLNRQISIWQILQRRCSFKTELLSYELA